MGDGRGQFWRESNDLSHYRIYQLDRAGRITSGAMADCTNDIAAFAWAKTVLDGDARAEIWQDARCAGYVAGATISRSLVVANSSVTPGQWLAAPGLAAPAGWRNGKHAMPKAEPEAGAARRGPARAPSR